MTTSMTINHFDANPVASVSTSTVIPALNDGTMHLPAASTLAVLSLAIKVWFDSEWKTHGLDNIFECLATLTWATSCLAPFAGIQSESPQSHLCLWAWSTS